MSQMPLKHSNKPGRPTAITPSKGDRQRVALGIAGGLSMTALADALGVSRRTFGRVFATEIGSGRAQVMLEMLACLYRAARKGNGAAAKALLGFIDRAKPEQTESVTENRWAGLADRILMHGDRRPGILPESENFKLDS
jgi:AraC-like DNA-binding protein